MKRRLVLGGFAGVAAAAAIGTASAGLPAAADAEIVRQRLARPKSVIADSQGNATWDLRNGRFRIVAPARGFVHDPGEIRAIERT